MRERGPWPRVPCTPVLGLRLASCYCEGLPRPLPGPPGGARDVDASQVFLFQRSCSNHGSWSWSICPSRSFLTLPVSWEGSPFQTGLRLDRQEDGSGQQTCMEVRGLQATAPPPWGDSSADSDPRSGATPQSCCRPGASASLPPGVGRAPALSGPAAQPSALVSLRRVPYVCKACLH